MAEFSASIPTPGWNYQQHLVNEYLSRAIEEFDTNRLAIKLIRRLSLEFPGAFLAAAMQCLISGGESGGLRHLTSVLLRLEGSFEALTDPQLWSRENAVSIFKRFLQIDRSFDVQLARKLPDRRGMNWAEALGAAHSTRALDILDQTSNGRRLLPVVSHLVDADDARISAKATLFVGRRVQNPSWTTRQLTQADQRVRANAVEALWGVNSPAAARILEDCRADRNHRVAGNALLGLHLLGRTEIEGRVMVMSTAGEHELRSTAAWLLGRLEGQDCIDCLTRLVKDEHPQVRSRALWSLLEIRRTHAKNPEATKLAIDSAATALFDGSQESFIQIRLAGSKFKAT